MVENDFQSSLNPFSFPTKTIGNRCYRVNNIKLKVENLGGVKKNIKAKQIGYTKLEKFDDKSFSSSDSASYSDIDDSHSDIFNINEEKIFSDKKKSYAESKYKIVEKTKEPEPIKEIKKEIIYSNENQKNKMNDVLVKNYIEMILLKANQNNKSLNDLTLCFAINDKRITQKLNHIKESLKKDLFIQCDDIFFTEDLLIPVFEFKSNNSNEVISQLKNIISNMKESEEDINKIKKLNLEFEILDYIECKENPQHGNSIVIRPKLNNPLTENYIDFIDVIISQLLDKKLTSESEIKANNYVMDKIALRYEPLHINCSILETNINKNNKMKGRINDLYNNFSKIYEDECTFLDDSTLEILDKGFNAVKLGKKLKGLVGDFGITKLEKLVLINKENKIISEINLI